MRLGGTLKVFGDTLKPDIPYKTLLMSNQDTAAFAVRETLEKYGLTTEDPDNYCLVQVISPSREERDHGAHTKEFILDDNACPLAILMQHPPASGSIIFQIRRCPPDILTKRRVRRLEQQQQQQQLQQQQQPPQQQFLQQQIVNVQQKQIQNPQMPVKPLQQQQQQHLPPQFNRLDNKQNSTRSIPDQVIINNKIEAQQAPTPSDDFTKYPFLLNLTEDPNSAETKNPKILIIRSEFCEIGNNLNNFVNEPPSPSNYLNINMPNIAPRHCAIKTNLQNGLITLLPYFETYLNGTLIKEETILETNDVLSFGKYAMFRFIGPIMRQLETHGSLNRPLNKNHTESETSMKKIGSLPNQQHQQQQNVPPPLPQKPQFHTIDRSTLQNRPLPANYGTLYDSDASGSNLTNSIHVMSDSKLLTSKQPPNRPTQANYGILYEDDNNSMKPPTKPAKKDGNKLNSDSIESTPQHLPPQIPRQSQSTLTRKKEVGIPGLIEFNDADEDALLMHISNTNQFMSQFKLAPVYTMYMMLRYRLSHKYCGNNLQFNEKLNLSLPLIFKMVNMIREAINQNHLNKTILPYWLANSSEFLYFLKQDNHLSQVSYDAQELLADCVRMAFYYLVNLMQQNLDFVLNAFIDPSDHVEDVNSNQINLNNDQQDNIDNNKRPTLRNVIKVLNETMNLLRGSRVNAALTIQLFSQLFHYISTWLFNKLVNDNRSGLCSRYWGAKLSRRLDKIQLWAAKQGLELAADCHLAKVIQASFLLQASKHDIQDLSVISSNCFALNSFQLKCLLKNYMPAQGEPPISYQLANNLISIAQNTADELLKSEGRLVQVEEEVDLKLPFLLPEDGHSCDVIKGLPNGLLDYLENLQNLNLCWLLQNRQGTGSWTEYMSTAGIVNNSNSLNEQDEIDNLQQQYQIQQQHQLQLEQQNIYDNQEKRLTNVIESTQNLNINTEDSILEQQQQLQQPQIVKMILNKKNGGLGLSIVGAIGQNQTNTGIYIKSVVPGGAADLDGRLQTGDLLIAVDDHSLMGITQEKAADILTKSGPNVCLTIAKDAAFFHGLDALLNKSPTTPVQPQQQYVNNNEPAILTPPPISSMNNGGKSIPILYQNIQTNNRNGGIQNIEFVNNLPPANIPLPPPPTQQTHEPPKRVQFSQHISESSIPPPLPSPPSSVNTSKSSSVNFFNTKSKNVSHETIPQRPSNLQFLTSPIFPQSTSATSLNPNKILQGTLAQEQMRTPELPVGKEPPIIMNRHSFDRHSFDQASLQQQINLQQQSHQQQMQLHQQQHQQLNSQTRDVVMDFEYESEEVNEQQTPSVIGANEIYLDPRARIQAKKQQQKMLEKESLEGEKLSFKDKMKLFAKEVGETTPDVNNKIKVSKKQREIESKLN